MGTEKEFGNRSRKFAQRFLRTAVVVDDEAYMAPDVDEGPKDEIVAPDRHWRTSVQEDQSPVGGKSVHALNARSIMDAFSSLGVICGVVSPTQSEIDAVKQADIVVLDWLLRDGSSKYTLKLLRRLLTEEGDRNSLRLVAIYTGEQRLEDIYQKAFDELNKNALDPKDDGNKTDIPYRHGRLVLYAKPEVSLAATLKDRSVAEGALPGRLLDDFASMTEGLLPGIALTSLTAVREGEHKILDRFSAELDPAFLAHMACLPDPEDAERQIVAHVAEELRGLADEIVAAESPAGKQAVERWIRHDGRASFEFGDKKLDPGQTIQLATEGLEASTAFSKNAKKKAFRFLTAGFARPGAVDLDEQLAWIMSFRTVYNAPPPILWLGSVVTSNVDDDDKHLICMRPRCDSLRLEEKTSFIFLPLVKPQKKTKIQLVVKLGSDFHRLGIKLESASLILRSFNPSEDRSEVVATKRESDGDFEFTDATEKNYIWRGELTAEYAQRVAHAFATTLSRVAVDESEWLRGMSRMG